MGIDKATLRASAGGPTLAAAVAAQLRAVAEPVVEVGPGWTGLPAVREEPPGQGPLVAAAAGIEALSVATPVLVVACDLPLLGADVLVWLRDLPPQGSVLPVVDGVPQWTCGRWSVAGQRAITELAAGGGRSFQPLRDHPDLVFTTVPPHLARELTDVDTPADWRRLGLGEPR